MIFRRFTFSSGCPFRAASKAVRCWAVNTVPISESVTVTAEAMTVNLSSGEGSGTLDGNQLDQIALRGRDIFDAVSLMAGVVDRA